MKDKNKTIDPELLKANCSRVTEEDVRYDFTPAEIADMRAYLVEDVIESSSREALAKKIQQLLAEDTDDLENELHLVISKARVETDLESDNDLKGNKMIHYAQKIRQEHDLKFKLKWPVIVGEPESTFEV